MAFLDNSGDIILDAVLTDTGRMRLAKADGSFKIAKFALGDDEINYGLYDKGNLSGSAYYDITVLQTPVLEAFTNNTSLMKSKLMSLNRTDIFYLPVMKLYTTAGKGTAMHSDGTFIVPVDKTTTDNLKGETVDAQKTGQLGAGILNGYQPNTDISHIRVDQGLDNTLNPFEVLAKDLIETQYIVELDNRLGRIFAPPNSPTAGNTSLATETQIASATPSFVDDDNIATYLFPFNRSNGFVTNLGASTFSSIPGPRGTSLQFRIGASLNVRTSNFLFNEIGTTSTTILTNEPGADLASGTWQYIDSTVRVTGVNTGYRIDIPLRFIKSTG